MANIRDKSFEETISEKLGRKNYDKVKAVKIGIAGAGGLGSNCAANLVRTGFKRFKIIDYDIIDVSNLNRQFYFSDQVGKPKVDALKENLIRINPELDLETVFEKVEEKNIKALFSDCDIIVEAFDKAEYKTMLVSNLKTGGKLIVSVSGIAGFGSSDDITIRKISKDLIMIGDLKSDISDTAPLSPRVNVAAAKQADVVLEHVLRSQT